MSLLEFLNLSEIVNHATIRLDSEPHLCFLSPFGVSWIAKKKSYHWLLLNPFFSLLTFTITGVLFTYYYSSPKNFGCRCQLCSTLPTLLLSTIHNFLYIASQHISIHFHQYNILINTILYHHMQMKLSS